MNTRDHPRSTGGWRSDRRLSLFILALALAGCAGGGRGTDVGVQPGSPSVDVPVAPATSGTGASRSGASGSGAAASGATGPGAASGGATASGSGPDVTAPPGSADDAPVDIEVGGPILGIPNGPPLTPLQSFGEVAVGAESAPRRFRLRSSSGDAVEVLALTVKGDSFLLTENQCSGATLPPGGFRGCAFTVVFRPHQQGAATGEVLVRLTQRCGAGADPACGAGTGAVLATGRAASARERTVARLVGHGTTTAL